jgi:hypothetical protein
LILELVALKDISKGDELFLDYGPAWEKAWYEHVTSQWRPIQDELGEHYAPASVIDDTIKLLRTEQEQKDHPYPTNVETSCFYKYQDHADLVQLDEVERQTQALMKAGAGGGAGSAAPALNTYRWNQTKGIYDMKHLRPCSVLRRSNNDEHGRKTLYAVRILNRPGLDPPEVLPTTSSLSPSSKKKKATASAPILHIVTHVPRSAIRLTDKPHTTDTHLPGAFRHEVGLALPVMPVTTNDMSTEPAEAVV